MRRIKRHMDVFVCPISVESSGRAGIEWVPFRLHWGVVEASEYCPAKERDNYNNWEMWQKTLCFEMCVHVLDYF